MIKPIQKLILALDAERKYRPSVVIDSLLCELIDARDGDGLYFYEDVKELFKYVH